MSTLLLLLLSLIGHVVSHQLPDVNCLVVHLEYVQCFWNKPSTPQSNYTFYAWFDNEKPETECNSYLAENGTNIGCNQPYVDKRNRFLTFHTVLVDGNKKRSQEHDLMNKVRLNPPTNVTIKTESDSNLWLYWIQTAKKCVESQVRYRINDKEWDTIKISVEKQSYYINQPCSSCRYEVQVQSRIADKCGQSEFWSGWSEPVVWGSYQLPDVNCLVVHLEYVQCFWNKPSTPQSNYTFYAWFDNEKPETECNSYLAENGTNIGCNQPYLEKRNRFLTFHTVLVDCNKKRSQKHDLVNKVRLNPPTNVTIKTESDSNLWLYWNQTATKCVESQVRYRINDKEWDITKVSVEKQNYCINLPCSSCRYEVQVQSRIADKCGQSEFWSGWSEPVVWGSNNSTDPKINNPRSVWTPVLILVGSISLILLVMMLLHHERFRIILIPVVPKPALIPPDIERWFEHPKGLKESFKPNYNEHTCTVREYIHVPQSVSESSDSSSSSVTTDQTHCSVSTLTEKQEPAPQ